MASRKSKRTERTPEPTLDTWVVAVELTPQGSADPAARTATIAITQAENAGQAIGNVAPGDENAVAMKLGDDTVGLRAGDDAVLAWRRAGGLQ